MHVIKTEDGMIKIGKQSPLSGDINYIEVDMSFLEFHSAHYEWQRGKLIQEAFPNLDADQREFLLTGYTQEEWDEIFGRD